MAELPRGTVTLLFTDIEGSTRLLKQLGDRYGAVLMAHHAILREAATARGGREVDNQGDSFFFAFGRAKDALGAAVAAQRAFAGHVWPEGAEVRVRMGLHTGEPEVGGERYVGIGVHRAARIGSLAHGGQVLLSGVTRDLVEDEVAGVSVRELGSYWLKDMDRPERLFQLDIQGLQTEFPPLSAEKATEPRPLRRRAILLAALAGVIAAAVAVPIFALGQGGKSGSTGGAAVANSLGVVDPGRAILTADIGVGAAPTRVAYGVGAYWVSNSDAGTVSRVDPVSKAVQTIPVGSSPSGIAIAGGDVWVANSLDGTVSRIDPSVDRAVQVIGVGNGPVGIVATAGSIWVANTGDNTITKIDPTSGRASKPLPVSATELALGAGSLWASQSTESRVVRIDPATGVVQQAIRVGNRPSGIAFGNGAVWVANNLDGTVSRIDPVTNSVSAVIPVGKSPTSIAVDPSGVWVSNQFDDTLTRIDPRTNLPAKSIDVGNRPQGVTIADGKVLVAVRESGEGHRGGTLTFRTNRSPDQIDPAVAYDSTSWTILHMTNDGLVGFNQASGIQGVQLVPDLAASLPTPTDRGRTYTFRLRPGIRYSNGRPVRASDFRATLERDFAIGFPFYYEGLAGGAGCAKHPKRCDLSKAIQTDDAARTVAFHLTAADPEFLYKLALPFAYVLPAGTPHRPSKAPVPATGPYRIAGYRPHHLLRLVRNRYFHEWSRAAQPEGYPDEILFKIGGSSDDAIKEVLAGNGDAFSSSQSETTLSERLLKTLATRYASQVHVNPQPATIGLFMNTRVPPFDRLDVRRALNFAADRTAAAKAFGGADGSRPTCQVLPPYYPGYRPYCPYTAGSTDQGSWTAPNLARARALIAQSGTKGMKVTVYSWSALPGIGAYAVRLLRSLGYRTALKTLGDDYWSVVGDSRTRAQIGPVDWISDYPAPSGFFNIILTCASFYPNDPNNSNDAEFCDPRIDRQIEQALAQQAVDPEAARGTWQRIDRQTVDQAPWVSLVNPKVVDVLSKRVGNYQYSPADTGMLIDQLWVH